MAAHSFEFSAKVTALKTRENNIENHLRRLNAIQPQVLRLGVLKLPQLCLLIVSQGLLRLLRRGHSGRHPATNLRRWQSLLTQKCLL